MKVYSETSWEFYSRHMLPWKLPRLKKDIVTVMVLITTVSSLFSSVFSYILVSIEKIQ